MGGGVGGGGRGKRCRVGGAGGGERRWKWCTKEEKMGTILRECL